MRLFIQLLAATSLVLPALGASFPYITLNAHTNRLSDNGTALTFNGAPISGGNWTASGTTNSVLVGIATTYGVNATTANLGTLVLTNTLTVPQIDAGTLTVTNWAASSLLTTDASTNAVTATVASVVTKSVVTNALAATGSSADVLLGNGNWGVVAFANTTNSLAAPGTTNVFLNGKGLWDVPAGTSSGGGTTFIDGSSVTNVNLKSNWATKLTAAGTTNITFAPNAPVTLSYASGTNVATDASLGTYFRLTATNTTFLANPTNPTDGQRVIWCIIQDATGNRTLSTDTQFAFGTDITGLTLTTNANKRDFITAVFNSATTNWYVVGFTRGY